MEPQNEGPGPGDENREIGDSPTKPEAEVPTEADRIAVMNLFREIAEFGHRVRERKAAEIAAASQGLRTGDAGRPVDVKA